MGKVAEIPDSTVRRFTAVEAARLAGLSHRQLDYWARTGLLAPSERGSTVGGTWRLYSFDDLVRLRVLRRLLDAGMSLKKLRRVADILRDEMMGSGDPSPELTVLSDGYSIWATQSTEEVVDAFRQGRGIFGIAVGPVIAEMVEAVSSMPVDTDVPQVDQVADDDSAFADQIADHVRSRILALETHWQEAGESLTSWGDPEDWARRLVATIPDRSSWDDRIGPFYRTSTVADRLAGISRQAVAERRQRGSILALRTSNAVWVYPTWQLLDDGTVVPGLSDIISPFAARGIDGWEIAGWLESTFKELGGASPRQYLLGGGDIHLLASMAREAALRLAS